MSPPALLERLRCACAELQRPVFRRVYVKEEEFDEEAYQLLVEAKAAEAAEAEEEAMEAAEEEVEVEAVAVAAE